MTITTGQRAPQRADQIVSAGLGRHFTSPLKKRDKKKSNTFVRAPLQDMKRKHLLAKLALLQDPSASLASRDDPLSEDAAGMVDSNECFPPVDENIANSTYDVNRSSATECQPRRRIVPNEVDIRLYNKWLDLLPHLVDPFLHYLATSTGTALTSANDIRSQCTDLCTKSSTNILCLYFDREVFSVLGAQY
jgi:hypothetical protein